MLNIFYILVFMFGAVFAIWWDVRKKSKASKDKEERPDLKFNPPLNWTDKEIKEGFKKLRELDDNEPS